MLAPLIPMKLAIGPSREYGGPSLIELEKDCITAVIDLNQNPEEMKKASETSIKYVVDSRLKIPDKFEPIPVETLKYVTTIIHNLIARGHYVYLHCSASRGRYPTVAAAYLICLGDDKHTAMNKVKEVRAWAWIGGDKNYADSLDEFEKAHRGDCNIG